MTAVAIDLPKKELFRVDEVARILGLKTPRTVYDWIKKGKICYIVTPGGRKRITRRELERITVEIQEMP